MKLLLSLALLAVASTAHAQATVYRCERDGKIAFSDQPCQSGAKGSTKVYAAPGTVGLLDLQVSVRPYNVEGRDYTSLKRSLHTNGPKGYQGFASWNCTYEYTTKKRGNDCQIATVVTQVKGEILMPRWVDEASASVELQRRWSNFYSALKTHEDGHIQHGRELALLVKERLMGIGWTSCNDLASLARREFDKVYNNLKARDQEYDTRTEHGITQGTRF